MEIKKTFIGRKHYLSRIETFGVLEMNAMHWKRAFHAGKVYDWK